MYGVKGAAAKNFDHRFESRRREFWQQTNENKIAKKIKNIDFFAKKPKTSKGGGRSNPFSERLVLIQLLVYSNKKLV